MAVSAIASARAGMGSTLVNMANTSTLRRMGRNLRFDTRFLAEGE